MRGVAWGWGLVVAAKVVVPIQQMMTARLSMLWEVWLGRVWLPVSGGGRQGEGGEEEEEEEEEEMIQ